MARMQKGAVGILPAGALGAAFFYHLTRQLADPPGQAFFLERSDSHSGAALRGAGEIRIHDERVPLAGIWRPDLLRCWDTGWLPEIVLICTQPDQLLGIMRTIVEFLEKMHAADALDPQVSGLPIFVLCSNGIYFQRVRQVFVEMIEEAITFGRLPELWPERMPQIVGRLLRGVTIQTGQREGSGAAARYRPGTRGRTRLAGGDAVHRERVAAVLTQYGGWFEVAEPHSPTRAEFDKALVNLCANLLGQLQAIEESGSFRLLTVREILDRGVDPEMRELASHVIAVGRAVGAYAPQESLDALYAHMIESVEQHHDHVPSSLQWIAQELAAGTLEAQLTPTERWLLEPLIRYAHGAGLEESAHYFEQLAQRVEARLARARSFPLHRLTSPAVPPNLAPS